VDSPGGLDRVRSAHPLPNTLIQFRQANSLVKATLMFNVLPGTEISVHAEFSHCQQNWYYGLQTMYSSMALKRGGPCTFRTPHCQKVWDQDPHRIAATGYQHA